MSQHEPIAASIDSPAVILDAWDDNAPADGVQTNIVRVTVIQAGTLVLNANVVLDLDNDAAQFTGTGDKDCVVSTGLTGIRFVPFTSTAAGEVTVRGTATSIGATPGQMGFTFIPAGADVYAFTNIAPSADHALADGTSLNQAYVSLTRNNVAAGNALVTWTLSGRPSVHFIVDGFDKGQSFDAATTTSDGSNTIGFADLDPNGYGGPIQVSVFMKAQPLVVPANAPRTFHFVSKYAFDPIQIVTNNAAANGIATNSAVVTLRKGTESVVGTQITWTLPENASVHFVDDGNTARPNPLIVPVGADGNSTVKFVSTSGNPGDVKLSVVLTNNVECTPANSPVTFSFSALPDQYQFGSISAPTDGQPADGASQNMASVSLTKNGGAGAGTSVTWTLVGNPPDVHFVAEDGSQLFNPQQAFIDDSNNSAVRFVDRNRNGGTVQLGVTLTSDTNIKPGNSPRTFTFVQAADQYSFGNIIPSKDNQPADGKSQNSAYASLTKNSSSAIGTHITWTLSGNPEAYFVTAGGDPLGSSQPVILDTTSTSTVYFVDPNRNGGTVQLGVTLTSDTSIKPGNSPRTFTFVQAADQYSFTDITASRNNQPADGKSQNIAVVSLLKNEGSAAGTSVTWQLMPQGRGANFVDSVGVTLPNPLEVTINDSSSSTVNFVSSNPRGETVLIDVVVKGTTIRPANSPRDFTFTPAPDAYAFSEIGAVKDHQPAVGGRNTAVVSLTKNGGNANGTSLRWTLSGNASAQFVNDNGAAQSNTMIAPVGSNSASTVSFRQIKKNYLISSAIYLLGCFDAV